MIQPVVAGQNGKTGVSGAESLGEHRIEFRLLGKPSTPVEVCVHYTA